jgi:ureidoglycolate dehydrogenase (NAD+)
MTDIILSHAELKQRVTSKLTDAGLVPNHAMIVADVLVHADLRGVSSHGVMRMEHYIRRLQEGGLNTKPAFRIQQTSAVSAVFDGDDGLGHAVFKEATEHAIRLANTAGVGILSVQNSSHCGALSYFVQLAAHEGLIGIAMTNANKNVVPYGGANPFFGTNPIAFGIPAKTHKPIILDMATSQVAFGKILQARATGTPIPDNWGIDKDGNICTDPAKITALLPIAGPKGYGLGLIVDIFSGILAGSSFGPHVRPMFGHYERAQKLGHFVAVLNPALFIDKDVFLQQVDEMIEEIHHARPAVGFEKVMLPGEPEQYMYEQRMVSGIPIPEAIYQYLTGKS